MIGDPTNFLTTMAALSTAVQTFVDHMIKGRWTWLSTATPNNPANERTRQSVVHLASFLTGVGMAWSIQLQPLLLISADLRGAHNAVANYAAAGLLVSFGSSFVNEALDALRSFKQGQQDVRATQITASVTLPNATQ